MDSIGINKRLQVDSFFTFLAESSYMNCVFEYSSTEKGFFTRIRLKKPNSNIH